MDLLSLDLTKIGKRRHFSEKTIANIPLKQPEKKIHGAVSVEVWTCDEKEDSASRISLAERAEDIVKIEEKRFDDVMLDLVEWFHSNFDRLPRDPFRIDQANMITDPEKWFRYLQGNISEGPDGARNLFGALRLDLQRLRALLEGCDLQKLI